MPNHYLVIYKRAGAGWKLRECLPPGTRPRRSPFAPPDSFMTHAVIADRELRHHFTRDYRSHDQLHSYFLDLTVEFRVSAPVALVEGLALDPLLRLEKEIETVLVHAAKGLDWVYIEQEQIDLEQLLFGRPGAPVEGGAALSHLDRLRRFAASLGFELHRIAVARRLPPGEVRDQVVILNHRTAELQHTLDKQLELKLGAMGKLGTAVVDSSAAVVSRELDGSRSIAALGSGLQQVAGVYAALQGGAPPPLAPLPALAMSGTGASPALLGDGRAAATPLAALLGNLAAQLGAGSDPAVRSRLLPAALHLVAEVLRGSEASPAALEEHAAALQAVVGSCMASPLPLALEQVRLCKRLLDTAALRRELAGS